MRGGAGTPILFFNPRIFRRGRAALLSRRKRSARLTSRHLSSALMSTSNPPRRPRAIIFDLDGTLADTFSLIVAAFNAAITPHTGLTYSDADVIARFGIPDPQMIRRELADRGGAACEQAIELYHQHYEQRHGEAVEPFAGITEMLEE